MGSDYYHSMILPYAGIIIKVCRAYTNSQEDFEDYYQEVCLQIWRSHERFKKQCAWTTWIYKIALNVCLTYLKKKQHSPLTFASDSLPEEVSQDSKGLSENSVRSLYQAIHHLSEIDRAIILLYLEEQSNQTIAEIIGISANNVGVRIVRIKQRLTKLMNAGDTHNDEVN